MDEPTASLTRREVDLLLATVRRLKEQGVSIVFVSHRLDEVVEIAERVTVLRDGRKVGTFPAAEIDDNRLSELMTGESLEHTLSARPTSGRRRVLEVNGASRAGEFEDISFTIHEGEILGLIGLLGAGRTELALALFGMSHLDSGEAAVDGRWLNPLRIGRRSQLASPMSQRTDCRLGSTCASPSPTTPRLRSLPACETAWASSRSISGGRWRAPGSTG